MWISSTIPVTPAPSMNSPPTRNGSNPGPRRREFIIPKIGPKKGAVPAQSGEPHPGSQRQYETPSRQHTRNDETRNRDPVGSVPTGDCDFPSHDQARPMCRSDHEEDRAADQEVRLVTHIAPPLRRILPRLQRSAHPDLSVITFRAFLSEFGRGSGTNRKPRANNSRFRGKKGGSSDPLLTRETHCSRMTFLSCALSLSWIEHLTTNDKTRGSP